MSSPLVSQEPWCCQCRRLVCANFLCLIFLLKAPPYFFWLEIHFIQLRADRIAQLLDERDLGVLTSSMSLLVSLVSNHHEGYWSCLPKCVKILERLARNNDVPQEYTYYGIPSPWLQVWWRFSLVKLSFFLKGTWIVLFRHFTWSDGNNGFYYLLEAMLVFTRFSYLEASRNFAVNSYLLWRLQWNRLFGVVCNIYKPLSWGILFLLYENMGLISTAWLYFLLSSAEFS